MPRGWVKEERRRLISFLESSHVAEIDKILAGGNLVRYLLRSRFRPSELTEATRLLWELSFHPALDSEERDSNFDCYLGFLQSSARFPKNSPQVYRESLRLRRIFSNPEEALEKRIRAADAYNHLLPKFHLSSPVGKGEAAMAVGALREFLGEGRIERGTREYFFVNSPLLYLEDYFLPKYREEDKE